MYFVKAKRNFEDLLINGFERILHSLIWKILKSWTEISPVKNNFQMRVITNWLWPAWSVSMWNLTSECLQQSCFLYFAELTVVHLAEDVLYTPVPSLTLQWAGWPAKVKVKMGFYNCSKIIHPDFRASRTENPFLQLGCNCYTCC